MRSPLHFRYLGLSLGTSTVERLLSILVKRVYDGELHAVGIGDLVAV